MIDPAASSFANILVDLGLLFIFVVIVDINKFVIIIMISSFSAGMVLSVRKSNKILFMFSINGTKVHFKNLLLPFCEVLLISHQILR